MLMVYETVADAYEKSLKLLIECGRSAEGVRDHTSIGSNFGELPRATKELVGYSFQIDNPQYSLLLSEQFVLKLPFCYGLLIWTLAGSDDIEWISYYNPQGLRFSDDKRHLKTAFGYRLFSSTAYLNQIEAICNRLKMDPNSRRTFASICIPQDNFSSSRDFPCCIGIQYLIRDNSLDALTYMRSQSALKILPYDLFLFTSLQSYVASLLGLKVGRYIHICGSFHLYKDEIEMAKKIVDSKIVPLRTSDFDGLDNRLDQISLYERKIREATVKSDAKFLLSESTKNIDLDSAYGQIMGIFLLYSGLRLNLSKIVEKILAEMKPPLQSLAVLYTQEARRWTEK